LTETDNVLFGGGGGPCDTVDDDDDEDITFGDICTTWLLIEEY
jgi:hypothetical protein